MISAGKFGERWEQLARAFGCRVDVERAPYGETVSPTRVRENLAPTHTVVYMQATESSTGVRHDVEGVARVLEGTNTLLVGAITGLGTTRFNIDGWGVDVIIGGSQKAVMIPPGLAYCAVSDRACKKWKRQKIPGSISICARKEKMARKGSPRIHRQLPWLPACLQRLIICASRAAAIWRRARSADFQCGDLGSDDTRRQPGTGCASPKSKPHTA
ncbi:MAG: aminotransferase class V-fold PLP-dependent enzyme [Acidobacteriia bacterium]|nr:aminotransferase class V-fold PLP-dependent enzyme [Terriglobia bacterium]